MNHEAGDDYVHRIATLIRDNGQRLGQVGLARRRKARSVSSMSVLHPFGWIGFADRSAPTNSAVLSLGTHHLFYLLMRFESLGIDVGSLDVKVDALTRPLSYVPLPFKTDKSDTLSIAESIRSSFSAVSRFSLGSAWWSKPEPRSVDAELKYIYSSFTKLPSLSLHAPGPKIIAELALDPPADNAIPLDSFKYLQNLECLDIDPRALLGWDRLSESLRSLTIKRSGLHDPTVIFVDAILDDQLRRGGDATRSRIRKLGRRASRSCHSPNLPETVKEESEDSDSDATSSPTPFSRLSPLKWAFLRHLSLADNALTTMPSSMLTILTSLTHLDLSTNLLVSVPHLSTLYNLTSLNLSGNMIDSVLGIYTKLGQVLNLNLSHNRLESLCGLERLLALEHVDLRHNRVDDVDEVGRLAVLPNIVQVWIEGNPLVEGGNYRVRCFRHFLKEEGKTVQLDGTLPTFNERRQLSSLALKRMSAPSLPVTAFTQGADPTDAQSSAVVSATKVPSPVSSPSLLPSPLPGISTRIAKPKKKRNKRIVTLNADACATKGRDAICDDTESRHFSEEPESYNIDIIPPEPSGPTMQETDSARSSETLAFMVPGQPSASQGRLPRSIHSRSRTEHGAPSPSSPVSDAGLSTMLLSAGGSLNRRSEEMATQRRNRLSASVYELSADLREKYIDPSANHARDADAFRAKIEALRAEMGDNWLQVLGQSRFSAGSPQKHW